MNRTFILITRNEDGTYSVGTASERDICALFNDGAFFCKRVQDLWPSTSTPKKRHLAIEGKVVAPKQALLFEELDPKLTS